MWRPVPGRFAISTMTVLVHRDLSWIWSFSSMKGTCRPPKAASSAPRETCQTPITTVAPQQIATGIAHLASQGVAGGHEALAVDIESFTACMNHLDLLVAAHPGFLRGAARRKGRCPLRASQRHRRRSAARRMYSWRHRRPALRRQTPVPPAGQGGRKASGCRTVRLLRRPCRRE